MTKETEYGRQVCQCKIGTVSPPLHVFGFRTGTPPGQSPPKCEMQLLGQTSQTSDLVQNFSQIHSAVLEEMHPEQTDRQTANLISRIIMEQMKIFLHKKMKYLLQIITNPKQTSARDLCKSLLLGLKQVSDHRCKSQVLNVEA